MTLLDSISPCSHSSVYVCVRVCIRVHSFTGIYTCVFVCVCMCIRMHAYIEARVFVCICACMCVYVRESERVSAIKELSFLLKKISLRT